MAIKRILVPLDGSSLAEHALPYAMTLARRLDARLELARAVFPSLGFLAEPSSEEIETAELERFALEAVARQLLAAGLRVGCHVGCGRPAPVLIEMVSRVNAGLVVLSTHGRSSGGRWSYGRVADEVLRTAPVPVLLVSTVCERTWPNDQIRRILVPLDGSSLAAESLEPASELARAADAELLLVQIVEIPVVTEASPQLRDPEAELARAREYLDRIADRMKASGLAVTSYSAVGDPSATLALIAHARCGSDRDGHPRAKRADAPAAGQRRHRHSAAIDGASPPFASRRPVFSGHRAERALSRQTDGQ